MSSGSYTDPNINPDIYFKYKCCPDCCTENSPYTSNYQNEIVKSFNQFIASRYTTYLFPTVQSFTIDSTGTVVMQLPPPLQYSDFGMQPYGITSSIDQMTDSEFENFFNYYNYDGIAESNDNHILCFPGKKFAFSAFPSNSTEYHGNLVAEFGINNVVANPSNGSIGIQNMYRSIKMIDMKKFRYNQTTNKKRWPIFFSTLMRYHGPTIEDPNQPISIKNTITNTIVKGIPIYTCAMLAQVPIKPSVDLCLASKMVSSNKINLVSDDYTLGLPQLELNNYVNNFDPNSSDAFLYLFFFSGSKQVVFSRMIKIQNAYSMRVGKLLRIIASTMVEYACRGTCTITYGATTTTYSVPVLSLDSVMKSFYGPNANDFFYDGEHLLRFRHNPNLYYDSNTIGLSDEYLGFVPKMCLKFGPVLNAPNNNLEKGCYLYFLNVDKRFVENCQNTTSPIFGQGGVNWPTGIPFNASNFPYYDGIFTKFGGSFGDFVLSFFLPLSSSDISTQNPYSQTFETGGPAYPRLEELTSIFKEHLKYFFGFTQNLVRNYGLNLCKPVSNYISPFSYRINEDVNFPYIREQQRAVLSSAIPDQFANNVINRFGTFQFQ